MELKGLTYWWHVSVENNDVAVTFRSKLIGCREPKYSGPDDDNLGVLLHFFCVMIARLIIKDNT
jgi:hypothetical protein